MSTWFTARIRSPTWRRPQRSAGDPEENKIDYLLNNEAVKPETFNDPSDC